MLLLGAFFVCLGLQRNCKLFWLYAWILNLTPSIKTASWASHYFDVSVVTFLVLDISNNILNISETITLGHLNCLIV